jgi:DNA-binding HxlR family transcriptional regulator
VRELRESGLLESAGAAGYGLTPRGRELIEQLLPLVAWSARWAVALTRGRGTPRSSR